MSTDTDSNRTNNIQDLFNQVKKYLKLQKEYIRLELIEKITIVFSVLIIIITTLVLGMVALFYLSLAFAYILSPIVGGLTFSFGIIACIHILIILIVLIFKKQLIINPMARFIMKLFSDTKK